MGATNAYKTETNDSRNILKKERVECWKMCINSTHTPYYMAVSSVNKMEEP
jgi:hypothetical protein